MSTGTKLTKAQTGKFKTRARCQLGNKAMKKNKTNKYVERKEKKERIDKQS